MITLYQLLTAMITLDSCCWPTRGATKCCRNVSECRKSLFSLLGPAFAYKCLLSLTVQVHLWRTYNLPVLLSGFQSLTIRPTEARTISLFHSKILRFILKHSQSSPIPILHFLLGELTVAAFSCCFTTFGPTHTQLSSNKLNT